jgi:siroheme decarboxylase
MNDTVPMDQKDRELLQWLQDEFPVTEQPWRAGAAKLGMTEEAVLSRVQKLYTGGIIRSVRTLVDKQRTSGSSTLIAMSVPEEKIQEVVPVINDYPSITHNYLREHTFNLWFTVSAENEQELMDRIDEIQRRTGASTAEILDLRTVRVFKLDVRFRFSNGPHITGIERKTDSSTSDLDATDRAILRITQDHIPLVDEPFRKISEQLGRDQSEVLTRLEHLVRQGYIKRIGGSVNQRRLGIVANAVVAWKVQKELAEKMGWKLSSYDEVTHCYERRTVPGVWDYNIFTVMHGYDRPSVETCAKRLSETTGIGDYRIIFSTHQFKRTSMIHHLQNSADNEQKGTPNQILCCYGDKP